MLKMHRKMVSTHHVITNILIKLNEDDIKAAAEAYMYAACKYRNGMVVVARCCDIDLWEKRDGKRLVVKRTVAGDNTMILHPDFASDYNNGRDKVKNPSYNHFETIKSVHGDKKHPFSRQIPRHGARRHHARPPSGIHTRTALPAPENHRVQVFLLVVHGHEKRRVCHGAVP